MQALVSFFRLTLREAFHGCQQRTTRTTLESGRTISISNEKSQIKKALICRFHTFCWSGRGDLFLRPPEPHSVSGGLRNMPEWLNLLIFQNV
jgi:hypothetical protein